MKNSDNECFIQHRHVKQHNRGFVGGAVVGDVDAGDVVGSSVDGVSGGGMCRCAPDAAVSGP